MMRVDGIEEAVVNRSDRAHLGVLSFVRGPLR